MHFLHFLRVGINKRLNVHITIDKMKTSGNVILITGGATGIGYALAERFVKLGNEVIICGRREDKLNEAKRKLPSIHVRRCNISKEDERKDLLDWVSLNFKGFNVLVNNAGIQRPIDLTKGMEDLLKNEDEIEVNFRSQVYLAARSVPMLSKQKDPVIINVSSGLGFVPLAMFPIYCATKAAIHSFTMSLRHQLSKTPIRVFEVIPPTVYDTELKGKPIPKTDYSVSAAEMADAIIAGLEKDQYEIAAGPSNGWMNASKSDLDKAFNNMNH
jgi:uncharacterized oxidoreductase